MEVLFFGGYNLYKLVNKLFEEGSLLQDLHDFCYEMTKIKCNMCHAKESKFARLKDSQTHSNIDSEYFLKLTIYMNKNKKV